MKLTPTVLAFLFLLRSIASAQSVIDSSITVQPLVSGLSAPTGMAFLGPNDILVLQKNDGRVRRVISGILQTGEVLDVAVDSASERGLLGIAVHPQFPATPFVYLYFTESSTGADTTGSPTPLGNRVYRYTWNGSKLTSPTLILALPVSPGPNHNGGVLTFGPDGKLYVVIGDLNLNGQLQNFPSGPPPDDTGVIVRLNDDGTTPSDNPFFSQGGNVAKYYAYGIRNSFGMAFDPVTGNLWMTENGPNLYDEINLVEPGFNSGWEQLMGPDARDPEGVANLFAIPGAHYRDPSFSWLDTVGPTALVFLDSSALGPQYLNNMFVGDINGGVLYRFRPDASRERFEFQNPALADLVADNSSELSELVFGTGFGGITDVKVGPDGFLYIVSFSGRILVILPVKPVVTITAPDSTATEAGATTGFFTVSRTGSTASSLTVNYTVGGSASHGLDYNSLSGNVIIPAGASSANIVILPNDDLTVEGNETVVLTLGSHAAYTIGSPASATVTITDNDGSGVSCPAEIIRDNLAVGQTTPLGVSPGPGQYPHRRGNLGQTRFTAAAEDWTPTLGRAEYSIRLRRARTGSMCGRPSMPTDQPAYRSR